MVDVARIEDVQGRLKKLNSRKLIRKTPIVRAPRPNAQGAVAPRPAPRGQTRLAPSGFSDKAEAFRQKQDLLQGKTKEGKVRALASAATAAAAPGIAATRAAENEAARAAKLAVAAAPAQIAAASKEKIAAGEIASAEGLATEARKLERDKLTQSLEIAGLDRTSRETIANNKDQVDQARIKADEDIAAGKIVPPETEATLKEAEIAGERIGKLGTAMATLGSKLTGDKDADAAIQGVIELIRDEIDIASTSQADALSSLGATPEAGVVEGEGAATAGAAAAVAGTGQATVENAVDIDGSGTTDQADVAQINSALSFFNDFEARRKANPNDPVLKDRERDFERSKAIVGAFRQAQKASAEELVANAGV